MFGALPASAPIAKPADAWMFTPMPIAGFLASRAAPPTSAFARQDAPDVSAITPEQATLQAYARRRSQAFIPASAFVATANSIPTRANSPSGRQSRAEFAQAQGETAAPRTASGAEPVAFQTRTSVVVDKTKALSVPLPFNKVVVGDEDIADVVAISDRRFNIVGRKIGATNVMLYDQQMHLLGVVDVNVRLDTDAMSEELRRGSGQGGVHIREVNGNIVLSGNVSDGLAADRAMRVAAGMVPEGKNVVNNLSVASPQQVMLQVRFVEADRQAVRNLGVRWNAFWHNGQSLAGVGQQVTGASGTAVTGVPDAIPGLSGAAPFATILTTLINSKAGGLDVVLSALEDQQVVRRLAEPNLMALSGQSADFWAGGEFPVPISSTTGVGGAPTVTIEYKKFGVHLKFTPTVLANGVISLKLEPEVSDLDPTISVQTAGVQVPGIITRSANTTVELRDGQAFGIAGMLQSKSQRQLDAFPWLGTVPYLGALFSSKQFLQNETELVVLVSPHLVKPASPNQKLMTPFDTTLAGNDVDMFLKQQLEVPKSQPTYVTPDGHAQMLDAGMAAGAPGVQQDPNRWRWPWETK